MGEIVAAVGTCHTPYMFTRPPDEDPNQLEQAGRAMNELGKVLDETKPDAILFFGADHVETFSVSCVPSFAIVAGDRAMAKFAGREHNLPIHRELAEDILNKLVVDHNFDMAYSEDAELGHAFSIPFEYVIGKRNIPVVPFFTNVYVPPLPTPRRCEALGKAIAQIVKGRKERVAIIASGGMSHFPGTTKYLNPEFDFDRWLVSQFEAGHGDALLNMTGTQLDEVGNTEMLSWAVMFGAIGASLEGDVVSYVAILSQKRQKHETESDLRAVALSGDPEALISGLVKLHALAKLPRRLDPNFEASASHPSLARRVRDIREAGQLTPATLGAPVVLVGGTTTVTLHPERLEWREGDASTHSLAYASLADLRIEADNRNATRIVASDPQGRRWSMALATEDVARAQAALDVIDARVRPSAGTSALRQTVGALVALLVVVSATGAGQIAAWIVAGLAVFSFERPMTRAAGVAGLVAATLALRDPSPVQFPLILMLSSGLLLFLGHRDARVVFSARTWRFVNVTGVLAMLTCLPLVWWGATLLSLHQTARTWTAPAVYALAFAAANAMRERRRQPLTIAALVAGVAAIVLGETRTIDTFLGDPFLEQSIVRTGRPLRGEALSPFTVHFTPSRLVLAPDANAFAIASEDEDDRPQIHIGRPGAAYTAIDAADALFVNNAQVLLLKEERDSTTLWLVDVDRPAAPRWQHSLDLTSASLAVDRASSRWRVIGQAGGDVIAAVSGPMDGGPIETRLWHVDQARGTTRALAVAGAGLLISETRYEGFSDFEWSEEWWLPFMPRASMSTTFAVIDGATRTPLFDSSLFISCAEGRYMDDGPVCTANDGTRTHVARISPVDGTVIPLAQFGTFISLDLTQRWAVGWSRVRFALDLESDALFTAEAVSDRVNRAVAMGGAEHVVAVATSNPANGGATIRLYRTADGASATR